MSENSKQSIATTTEDLPPFTELGIAPPVLSALNDVGYETPSPIQAATIPPLLEGRDVVGMAQTGTGKTAAFAVPVLSQLAEAGADKTSNTPAAIVLTPTRELALQVSEAFGSYAAHMNDFTVLPVYGGQSYGPQLQGLRRGAQVVVGTPGRVIDHLKRGSLDLSSLQYLVLDEADEMLRMGFAEDVEQILSTTPDEKQVALFSATMPSSIRKIAAQYLTDPLEMTVKSQTKTAPNTRQRYLSVTHSYKLDALTRIFEVENYDGVIVFVRTKQATEELADKLQAHGVAAAAINGDIPQQARERIIGQLRSGTLDFLVATDVAARGLDVERISHVVNYDIPMDTESYVHRIGRTGRAGRTGEAILFVTPRENRMLRSIERATGQPIEKFEMPSAQDVTNSRITRFGDRITQALSANDLTELRSVVEDYEQTHDVAATDIAAAVASLLLNGESLAAEPLPEPDTRSAGPGKRKQAGKRNEIERTTYRIAVGRSNRVQPGAVVGAIANEGGLTSSDIGHIDIRSDHTLVDLPAHLPDDAWQALKRTRIGGQPINLRKDTGRPPQGPRSSKPGHGKAGYGRPGNAKPSHDKSGHGKTGYGKRRAKSGAR